MSSLLWCTSCHAYTLRMVHSCGAPSIKQGPAKWSPEDKYGSYRRQAKKEELVARGFI